MLLFWDISLLPPIMVSHVLPLPSRRNQLLPALRFGKALARLRSQHAGPLKREAKKEIRDALATYRNIARNTKANARWIKWANLQPVLDHLM